MPTDKRDDDSRSARQRIEAEKQNPDTIKHMEGERQRHDFIERTRPDDPSEHQGQLTRDNVNPDIPSAPPGTGGIVDPNTLGMPQAQGSINEPPGSTVGQPHPEDVEQAKEGPQSKEREPLPSNDELHGMKRSELDELAEARGVDVSTASNKEDVIELLRRDARKRK